MTDRPADTPPLARVIADERIAAQIAEAARRRELRRLRRQTLDDARRHGLRARHRAKLARPDDGTPPPAA